MVRGSGVNLFTMREVDEMGMRNVMDRAINLASKNTAGFIVSFDMDVVDPDDAPGVGTPVRGGITYREAHLALEMIADCGKMLAFELVGGQPHYRCHEQDGDSGCGLCGLRPGEENSVTGKIRVGILFGGRSGEHDVSLQSAASVIRALDPAKYEVVPIGITREGHWRVGSGGNQAFSRGSGNGVPLRPPLIQPGPSCYHLHRRGSARESSSH